MTRTSAAIESASGHGERDAQAGFTLMEVVLALLIVGMLATLAVPYVRPGVGVAVVKAKAFEIASLLRRDRNAALRSGDVSKVSIDAGSGLVSSQSLRQSVSLPRGLTLQLQPDRAEGVIFQADGRSSGARIILASRSATIAIEVNRTTAAIGVSEISR